ncbi:fluoride efflux transporter CrcB [Microtetraspora malaysiensis]|uniref:fluoride efflux transporter CrcB n=1 Tax=Microtetraspora malaysiensis TaxID=161358 RepID=UPI003D8BC55E
MTLLLVFLGGAVGAPTRYLMDRLVQRWHDTVFPWGTFVVNVTGSFILGLLTGLQPGPFVATLAGSGFCGALTTFSTFGFETMRLIEEGSFAEAALNVVGSLLLGVLAAAAGYGLAVHVL